MPGKKGGCDEYHLPLEKGILKKPIRFTSPSPSLGLASPIARRWAFN